MSLVMVLAMGATASATVGTSLDENGEAGAFSTDGSPESKSKILVLEKELTAYNPDGSTVNAPEITFNYAIAGATLPATDTTVTDNKNVTAPVKTGVGAPTITASISWANTETLTTSATGTANKKSIEVDFTGVDFGATGIYRYVISETVTDPEISGVTPGSSRTRYVDVYVRASEAFSTASDAGKWDIYGYTCFINNEAVITEANKAATPVKTTGFVAHDDGTTVTPADSYYTFNLTVSKTVTGDAYGAANNQFPFTVLFTNDTATKNFDIIGAATGTVTWTEPAAGTIAGASGVVSMKSGSSVTYTGIPCGTSVEVYETNTATGVTYKVQSTLTKGATAGTPVVDDAVSAGTAPTTAAAQGATKTVYQSTKVEVDTEKDKTSDSYTIAVENIFLTISPTGIVLRYAPYALVLIGGMLLLFLGWKFLRREQNEEA